MGFVDEAHDDRALLNSLLGVFDLEYPALGGAVRVSWSSWEKRELDVQGDGIVIVVVSEHGGQKESSKGFKRKGTGIGGGREGESRRQARWKIERVGERQGGDAANVTDCLLFSPFLCSPSSSSSSSYSSYHYCYHYSLFHFFVLTASTDPPRSAQPWPPGSRPLSRSPSYVTCQIDMAISP